MDQITTQGCPSDPLNWSWTVYSGTLYPNQVVPDKI